MPMNFVFQETVIQMISIIGLAVGGGKYGKILLFLTRSPYGNFKISGVWGGEAGNSKTFGIVHAGKLNYKEFKTENSNIAVQVDANATQIYGKNIIHNKGTLTGILAFPRKNI